MNNVHRALQRNPSNTVEKTCRNYPVEKTCRNYPVEKTCRNYPVEKTCRNYPVEKTCRNYPVEKTCRNYPLDIRFYAARSQNNFNSSNFLECNLKPKRVRATDNYKKQFKSIKRTIIILKETGKGPVLINCSSVVSCF